jgi:HEPN domain-containing protein
MVVKSKKFDKKYALELMRIAEQDLESAKALALTAAKRKENVFLLAQQALEKGLKAVICWRGKELPFVHDIGILVTVLSDGAKVPFGYSLNDLSEFAAIRRYLEGFEQYSTEEVEGVLNAVSEALTWCQGQLQLA